MRAIRLSVERAAPGDRDVLLLVGVNERRVVHALHPLPAREDQGQVAPFVLAEADHRAGLEVQVHVAPQVDCAGEKLTGGNDDAAASGLAAFVDRTAEGVGAIGLAVGLGAEADDVEIAIWE